MTIARNIIKANIFATLLVSVLMSSSLAARSQDPAASYPKMAPIDQYLIARSKS